MQPLAPIPVNPCYAIIPAAGSSRRMGQHKLLLPWPARQPCLGFHSSADPSADSHSSESPIISTVIDRVLEAWTNSHVAETIVVIRRDDEELRDACRRWPVTIVHPLEATEDMKGSVCVGLQLLKSREVSLVGTRCFIAPADLPGLTSQVIDRLIATHSEAHKILIPRFGLSLEASTAGHPALVPWELTGEIFRLGPQAGVDTLVKRHPQEFVLFPPELAVSDIDTPAEYQAALKALKHPE